MGNFEEALSDLFKPTERAFKGLTILFSIYSVSAFVCLVIVSQLTEAHLRYAKDNGQEDYDPNGEIRNKKDQMVFGLLIFGGVFFILSIISLALKRKYRGYIGKQAAEYMDPNRLISNESRGVRSPSMSNDYKEGGEMMRLIPQD